jgi:hypothetical protein
MRRLAFALLVSCAAWFVLPENSAFAKDPEVLQEPRGIVVEAHFLGDYYAIAEKVPAWNPGGGIFAGYRSGRLTFGFDIALTSASSVHEEYATLSADVSYFDVMLGPTLQVAFLQLEKSRFEALALVGIRMGRHEETSLRYYSNTQEEVHNTYGKVGYRLGLGVRGWISENVAANLLVTGTHTVLLDASNVPSLVGVELLPGLMAMF